MYALNTDAFISILDISKVPINRRGAWCDEEIRNYANNLPSVEKKKKNLYQVKLIPLNHQLLFSYFSISLSKKTYQLYRSQFAISCCQSNSKYFQCLISIFASQIPIFEDKHYEYWSS